MQDVANQDVGADDGFVPSGGMTLRRGSVASLLRLEISIMLTMYNMIENIRVDLRRMMNIDITRRRLDSISVVILGEFGPRARPQATARGDIWRNEDTGRAAIRTKAGIGV